MANECGKPGGSEIKICTSVFKGGFTTNTESYTQKWAELINSLESKRFRGNGI